VGFAAFTGGDADLALQISAHNFDACVIEFDFVPIRNVSFLYVFASEEYTSMSVRPSRVSPFSSVDPLLSASRYRQSAGNGNAVAINNVNHLTNTAWYVDNILHPRGGEWGQTRVRRFHKVLRAVSPVRPVRHIDSNWHR
jgi:hypothetical protein